MTKQNYTSKSFIISIKSHERKPSLYNKPYEYRCNDEKWKEDNIIKSLLSDDAYFNDRKNDTSSNENDSQTEAQTKPNDEIWYDVRLVVHSHKDFSIGQVSFAEDVACFAQEFFLDPSKETDREKDMKNKYLPVIHITFDDSYVDNLYSVVNASLPSHISRSYQILDSSIWNKIVPFNRITKYEVGGTSGIYKAIQEIDSNYQCGLYYLEVAHEYANLNARLAMQAFLSGSHASGVSPFIFHSESAIEFMIQRELCEKSNLLSNNLSVTDRIARHRWRILLVDDKAIGDLSLQKGITDSEKDTIKKNRKDDLPWNSKLAIIKDLIQPCFNNLDIVTSSEKPNEKRHVIYIDYAVNIRDAEDKLMEKKYDLILLDYLLDYGKTGTEYGYTLLDNIYVKIDKSKEDGVINYEKVPYKIGPHGRFFFMFISAYTSAVYERLLAEGLNRSEKYWHIAVGACPTNTPQLFLYNLLKLMEKRLEDSGIEKISVKSIYHIVNEIYSTKPDIRHRANDYYQEVLDMQYYYRKMLDDVQFPPDGNTFNTTGSVLITDFIGKNVYLGGLLEHLTQLVHLTAFGTVRQWPEMWEEYIYFKSQFNINLFVEEGGTEDAFYKLCADIENYIIDLKSDRA